MTRHFNKHIEGIDLSFWHELIESHGELVTLSRGDLVCHVGQPTNKIGYVKSGYLIYTVVGVGKIGGFTFPDALFGDYPNCLHNLPARFDIMAGRKTEAWIMDATVLLSLYKDSPVVNQQGHRFAEAAYNSLIDRYCSFIAGGPLERYMELIRQHPQIEQDVPQKEIAEYLRITPTHLSRLRRDLLK
ncbi:MAG: hypothetical protein K2M05_01640 [Paramuribaculum sp.]|nr:hypothetical protein [Paramuribaculum sp.]MDE6303644.1 hypothetical protein [Paramuribaculum sp.]